MNRFETGHFEKFKVDMFDKDYESVIEVFKDPDNRCYYGTAEIFSSKKEDFKKNVIPFKGKVSIKRFGVHGKSINEVLYDAQDAFDWYFNHISTKYKDTK